LQPSVLAIHLFLQASNLHHFCGLATYAGSHYHKRSPAAIRRNVRVAKKYHPGQVVPEDGVYEAVHDPHRLMHQVTLPQGGRFPACKRCGRGVHFELRRSVKPVYIRTGYHAILEDCPDVPMVTKTRSA
jgi:hypothetical protein